MIRLWRVTDSLRGRDEFHEFLETEFDDAWYRREYPEARATRSKREAVNHYVRHGASKQYSPSGKFNERWYLDEYPDVKAAVDGQSFLSGYEHYLRHGRQEGRAPLPPRLGYNVGYSFDLLEAEFDPDWYTGAYPDAAAYCLENNAPPLQHYLKHGVRQRHSPNAWFDETWYVAYHADVARALKDGFFRCGFEHFLLRGRYEGYIPRNMPKPYLESKYPGITKPVGIANVQVLENKLTPPPVDFEPGGPKRMSFLLPTLDSEIMFGGYAAVLEWMRRFSAAGYAIRILICDDSRFNEELARYQLGRREGCADLAQDMEIRNVTRKQERVPVRRNDRFFAYSTWTALWAAEFARHTDQRNIAFLIQEYEAVFHAHDSFRAVVESAYRLPHIPIFNSRALADYFRDQQLGVFMKREAGAEPAWFSFEHALVRVERPDLEQLAARTTRRLLFYARPEAHAARNLFEIGILALRKALRKGVFDPRWTFHGIGALAQQDAVELDTGVPLILMPKTDAAAYGRMLGEHDIGLSLMMAPHPSLLPYEMAAAGLVVVTNRYDYRDDRYYAAISQNIISADPDIDSLTDALRVAVCMADDAPERIAGAKLNWNTSWSNAISDEMFSGICRKLWLPQ